MKREIHGASLRQGSTRGSTRLAAQTTPRIPERNTRGVERLRRLLQFEDWQVPPPGQEAHVEFELLAATTADRRLYAQHRCLRERIVEWVSGGKRSVIGGRGAIADDGAS